MVWAGKYRHRHSSFVILNCFTQINVPQKLLHYHPRTSLCHSEMYFFLRQAHSVNISRRKHMSFLCGSNLLFLFHPTQTENDTRVNWSANEFLALPEHSKDCLLIYFAFQSTLTHTVYSIDSVPTIIDRNSSVLLVWFADCAILSTSLSYCVPHHLLHRSAHLPFH